MKSLKLQSANCEIEIVDEGSEYLSPDRDLRSYSKQYRLWDEDEDYTASSRHGVIVRARDGTRSACLLRGFRGATGTHEHSAVVANDQLFVAAGYQLCCLSLPTLDLAWHVAVDWVTCFGVHYSPEHDCLISHGEIEIARLTLAGEVQWRVSGKDIFTGDLSLFADFLEVEDFNQERYRLELADGTMHLLPDS
jgi:hypothetical protein